MIKITSIIAKNYPLDWTYYGARSRRDLAFASYKRSKTLARPNHAQRREYYDPKTSLLALSSVEGWLSVDPLAEKYNEWSPYNYTLNNPVKYVDPDGNGPWKPKINNNGSTSYIMEEGDDASTLASQYGLDKNDANKLYSTMKNGKISGSNALQITGSEVLKLDLTSDKANDQRKFDQFRFATKHTKTKGGFAFFSNEYYRNIGEKSMLSGFATMTTKSKSFPVYYEIPIYRPATFDDSSKFPGLAAYPRGTKQNYETSQFNNQVSLKFNLFHPETANDMGDFDIMVHSSNSNEAYDSFQTSFPKYNNIPTFIPNDKK